MGDWSPQSDLVGLEIILIVGMISGDDTRDNASDGGSCLPLDCSYVSLSLSAM
jgi:hypothetical protein